MSCTFQTWNSTKNNNFHQEFDSLITYLRWLDQMTYLTPRWHQVSFREFSWEEFCHLQIWSAKSKTMLCNQQTWRQEMFPDKVFPSHTVPQVFLSVVFVNKVSTMTYRIWTLSTPSLPVLQQCSGSVSTYSHWLASPSRAKPWLTWLKFQCVWDRSALNLKAFMELIDSIHLLFL